MDFLPVMPGQPVAPEQFPELPYAFFYEAALALLEHPDHAMTQYYGTRQGGYLKVFCTIAHRLTGQQWVAAYTFMDEPGLLLAALGQHQAAAKSFEQQLSQKLGLTFAYGISEEEQAYRALREAVFTPH